MTVKGLGTIHYDSHTVHMTADVTACNDLVIQMVTTPKYNTLLFCGGQSWREDTACLGGMNAEHIAYTTFVMMAVNDSDCVSGVLIGQAILAHDYLCMLSFYL